MSFNTNIHFIVYDNDTLEVKRVLYTPLDGPAIIEAFYNIDALTETFAFSYEFNNETFEISFDGNVVPKLPEIELPSFNIDAPEPGSTILTGHAPVLGGVIEVSPSIQPPKGLLLFNPSWLTIIDKVPNIIILPSIVNPNAFITINREDMSLYGHNLSISIS